MDRFKWQALNQVVIVEEREIENKTDFGFDLGSDKNVKYMKGVVMSFGHGCPQQDGKYFISIGQEVLFDGYKKSDLYLDGKKYLCVYYGDLIAL